MFMRNPSQQRKKTGESQGAITLQSLGIGLAFALLAPYLLELAFPRRRAISTRLNARPGATANADFTAEPVNI